MTRIPLTAAIALAGSIIASAVFAARFGPPSFDLSWNTIDGGGGTSTGGTYELSGSAGQPDAAPGSLTGGSFELAGGFWPGASTGTVPNTCPADIAPSGGDGLVNINDLLAVINNWGPCPPGSCPADIAPPGGDNTVNVNDLLAVINAWGLCP